MSDVISGTKSALSNKWDGIHNVLDGKGLFGSNAVGVSDVLGLAGAAGTALSFYNSIGNAKDAISKLGAYKLDSNAGYGLSSAKSAFLNYNPIKSAKASDFGYDLSKAEMALLGSTALGLGSFEGLGAIPSFLFGVSSMIAGQRKAINEANKYNKEVGRLNNYNWAVLDSNLKNTKADILYNSIYNSNALGGPIELLGNGTMSPFGSRYAKGGVLKDPLSSNGADWNIDLINIGNGGTHEKNPYEGVQIGVDQQGTPNLVEEGEVIWNNYVFSNRMKVPKELREKLKLGDREMTYAEAVNSKKKEREERPNDPIEKRGFEAFLTRLGLSQEEERQKQEDRRLKREAKKAALQQAIMLAVGMQQPMLSPMYDEQMPQEEEMMAQEAPLGMPYAKGGLMGNLYYGLGPDSQWLDGLYNTYSPYGRITDNYLKLLYGNNYDNLLDINKIDDPVYRNVYNSNATTTINPYLKRLGIKPLQLNINKNINKPSPIRYVYEPLGETPKYFFPKLDKNNNPIKGQGSYDEGFKNWVSNLNDETLNKIYTSNPQYREAFSEGKFPTLADTLKLALDGNPGKVYDILSRYYYEHEGRPIQKDVNGNPLTRPVYPKLFTLDSNGLPKVVDLSEHFSPTNIEFPSTEDYIEKNFSYKPFEERINDAYTELISKWAKGESDTVIPELFDNTNVYNDQYGSKDGWMANLRYVPALGSAISVFSDLMGWTNKPDYTNANAVLEAAKGIRDVKYKPIGDYLTYRPLDRMFYQNQLNALNNALARNIVNTTGGNRGLAMAGLLTAGYNAINATGNLARQAEEYNDALRQQVAAFNRDTNKFNSQMDLEAQRANLGAAEVRMNAALNAAKMRDAVDERIGMSKSANLTNLFESIGDIGREEFTRNMINSNRAMYYTIGLNGVIQYKKAFDNLPSWELDFWRQQAQRDSRVYQRNGGRYCAGGFLTIKRRR